MKQDGVPDRKRENPKKAMYSEGGVIAGLTKQKRGCSFHIT